MWYKRSVESLKQDLDDLLTARASIVNERWVEPSFSTQLQ